MVLDELASTSLLSLEASCLRDSTTARAVGIVIVAGGGDRGESEETLGGVLTSLRAGDLGALTGGDGDTTSLICEGDSARRISELSSWVRLEGTLGRGMGLEMSALRMGMREGVLPGVRLGVLYTPLRTPSTSGRGEKVVGEGEATPAVAAGLPAKIQAVAQQRRWVNRASGRTHEKE